MSENTEKFRQWRDTLDPTHWGKKDLSACRLGWDAAMENQAWISILDELPDADTTVLVYNEDSDSHELAYYCYENGTFWNDGGDEIFVSHWKDLTTPYD